MEALQLLVIESTSNDVEALLNVLRNDALSAVSIAAATGAGFIRVNVLTGEMHTDQGPIVGRAADVARLRASLAPGVLVLADVFVKHAVPPAGLTVENAARDTWERGGSHGLVVTGVSTGAATPLERVAAVRAAVPDATNLRKQVRSPFDGPSDELRK